MKSYCRYWRAICFALTKGLPVVDVVVFVVVVIIEVVVGVIPIYAYIVYT